MPNNSVFTRRFSLSDLVYAASGYRQHHSNQPVSQLIVEGYGQINHQSLLDAVTIASETSPVCRLRLSGKWGFKRWSADGALPTVHSISREWNGDYSEDLDFIDTPLDLIDGPVAEVIQLVGSKTWLIFRIHHAVTDGVGLVEFVMSVFAALNGKQPQNYHSRITLENMPEGNLDALPATVRNAPVPFPIPPQPINTDRSRIWQRITLPGKDSRILLRTILALSQLSATSDKRSARIQVPVNLRRHLPEEMTSANLIGMIRLDVDHNETLRSLVKKFSVLMEQNQELPVAVKSLTSRAMFWIPLPLLRALEKRVIRQLLRHPAFRCSGTVSSLGMIQLEALSTQSFNAISAFGIPIPPLGTPLMAVIMSNNHQSELVISACQALINPIEFSALAEQFIQKLNNSC